MATASITKRTVDGAKAGERDQFIWDNEVRGFGLKVTPAGGRVYIYQYRIARPGEAERTPAKRYTIGKHGNLTPEQARKRAKALAAMVDQGIDPRQRDLDEIAAKDEAKRREQATERLHNEMTLGKMAVVWLDHYENEKDRRPSSVRMAKMVVNNHLKPALQDKPLPHISRVDLQPVIDAIPSKQRGMRRSVFAYASVFFNWAVKRGDIDTNPLAGMAKPEAPKARDRVLSDDELLEVWKASQKLGEPFGPFFRLLILTGQRRSEVAGMGWTELDRSAATWVIPPDRAKNGVAHIVPLSSDVLAELDRLARIGQRDEDGHAIEAWPKTGFVLTTTGRTPVSGITKAKRALNDKIAEANEGVGLAPWRIHDLRRTQATGFQRLGVRFEVTEAVQNRIDGAKGGVAGIYQRHDWKEEKRSALDTWARHLAALEKLVTGGNVLQLDAVKRSA